MTHKTANYTFLNSLLSKPADFFKKNTLNDLKTKACFSYEYTRYGFMETWESAFEKINNVQDQKRLFHELITSEHQVKPYLDIEWYKEDFPKYDHDKVKIYIKDKLLEIFKDEHNIELQPSDFKISSCHRKCDKGYKYSYHILICSENPMYIYSSPLKAVFLANCLRKYIALDDIYSPDIVDKGVYKTKQNIRLIGQCKIGDYTNVFVKDNASDNDLDYIITNIARNVCVLDVPEQEDTLVKITDFNNIELDSKIIEHIISRVLEFHPSAKLTSVDTNNFLQFNYTDRKEPCFCHTDKNVFHDQIGFFVFIDNNNIALAGCHSNQCLNEENKKIVLPITNISSVLLENVPKNLPVNCENDFSHIELNRIKACVENGNRGLADLLCDMFLLPSKRVIHIGSVKRSQRLVYIWNGDYWEEDINDTLFNTTVTSLVNLLTKTKNMFDNNNNTEYSENYIKPFITKINTIIPKLNDGGKMIDDILKFFNNKATDNTFLLNKDQNFYKLPCKNGMIDLKTLTLSDRVPEDLVTKVFQTNYYENADSSLFDNFVQDILTNIDNTFNRDKYNFFRWCIGQALTRDPKKLFVILHGPESYNGKSTFVGVVKEVLEWMTDEVDSSVILESGKKTKGSHSTELMVLKDLSMAFITETKGDAVIDDAQVKRLTGRDNISARQIYQEQTTFKSRCVPIVCTNKVIKLDLKDRALYERTVIFRLLLSFVNNPKKKYERQRDHELENKLLKNKDGVLKWLVDCGYYYCSNMELSYPAFVNEEKNDYMKKIDPYIDFIDRYFNYYKPSQLTDEQKDSDEFKILIKELIEYFQGYLLDNCIKRIPKTEIQENFSKLLEIKNNYFIGLKMKNNDLLF